MHAFRQSLRLGEEVLRYANERIDLRAADSVVETLIRCKGNRYFTGIGKSGLVAARMASSLSSIGLASHWIHASEWAHGELGSLAKGDVVTAVSHSGSTVELIWLAEQLEQMRGMKDSSREGIELIAFTGDAASKLAQHASFVLTCETPPGSEALALLPTSSVVASHHVFNAVLCECAARLSITAAEIAQNHPGGHVGRVAVHHEALRKGKH
ncbi:hypothetical protein AB1Y20_019296 [Prymnesium parvum]|uniref:SIS domain-containing protein n=1 Tax=Prymnesium parvum TaxID=97485 RepID=A0AB34JUP4_PRYPA